MARRQWRRRNVESISLLDRLMIIVAVIITVIVLLSALAPHYGLTFDLTGAMPAMADGMTAMPPREGLRIEVHATIAVDR